MAKINQQPKAPQWPWGGRGAVREKLVNRAQLGVKGAKKKGDPKNPALASAALLDSIGPAHSADELRLPMPPVPAGHAGDVDSVLDRPHLSTVAERMNEQRKLALERGLSALRAPPERIDRLKSLLQRESAMLELVDRLRFEMSEIERKRREEQAGEAY
jgi:hypothetical protein